MLTRAKRARNPDFSPDGKQMLVVTNKVQNNQLATLQIDQSLQYLTQNTDNTQYSTPRWSPDGKHLAVSTWKEGKRDIWIHSADGVPRRKVTNDIAIDAQPRWSPDGKYLYFTSDRSGVFNIYAVDLKSERLYQITNVLTGAFLPSTNPDQSKLFFTVYHSNGFAAAPAPNRAAGGGIARPGNAPAAAAA